MGLFKRPGDKANDAIADAGVDTAGDRRFQRAEELAASGERGEAVITGISRRLKEDFTDAVLRLEWFDPEPRVGAVRYSYSGDLALALRLGATVRIATQGDQAVIDTDAMRGTPWAVTDGGERSRKAPDQGVDDKALDWTVLSRLKKWRPETATVTAHERVTLMGIAAMNWDITVRKADGSLATISRDAVPSYARWYVTVGEEIPIAVDPKNPSKAQGDWPLLAEQRAVRGSRWQDSPPEGSIAALLLDGPSPVAEVAGIVDDLAGWAGLASVPEPDVQGDGLEAIEGVTVMRYAHIEAALALGRVPPAEHDAVAARDFGVPEGRWAAIKAGWQGRTMTDWRVGAAFGEAYEQAVKQRKK